MRATFTADQRETRTEAFLDWLRDQNIEPKDTFKIEINGDTMVAHQFVRDDKGLIRHDDGDPEVKTRTVSIDSDPPVAT